VLAMFRVAPTLPQMFAYVSEQSKKDEAAKTAEAGKKVEPVKKVEAAKK
jgi:hypothetical protein